MEISLEEAKKMQEYFTNVVNQMQSQESSKKEEVEVKETLQEQIVKMRVGGKSYFYIEIDKDISIHKENFTLADNALYNSFNYFKNEEEAKKIARFEYLNLKLIRLRDKLNGDWIPDWNKQNNEKKYFINLDCNKISDDYCYSFKSSNLYFKTEKLRDEFSKSIPKQEILEYLRF